MMITNCLLLLLLSLVCCSRGRNTVKDKDTDKDNRHDAIATMKMKSVKEDIITLDHYRDVPAPSPSFKYSEENNDNAIEEDGYDYKEILTYKEIAEISNEELINEKVGIAQNLFEGDIVLTNKQRYEVIKGVDIQNSIITDVSRYWGPIGAPRIPYVFERSFTGKTTVHKAIKAFTDNTCIRWVPKTSSDKSYVRFVHRRGCYSSVGKTGRRQDISLQKNNPRGVGCVHAGIAIHEMMHALGFYHEHSRSDRNKFVRILFPNIIPRMKYNFNKRKTNNLVPYDYGSIMQYGSTAFAIKRGTTTIQALDLEKLKNEGGRLGQRRGMSAVNIQALNALYCNGAPTPTPKPVKPAFTTTTPKPVKPASTTTPKPVKPASTHAPKPVKPGTPPPDTNFCPAMVSAAFCRYCGIRAICPKSCVENAQDLRTKCPGWAKNARRFCSTGKYKGFMWRECKKSCLAENRCQ